MTTNSEDSTSHVKGLSFIDMEGLDQDEYVKLEKIINDSTESPGVQLPFVPNTSKPTKCSGNSVNVQASVLHPAAPVFQPAIPPPSIVGFPIPVPAWTHRDPGMPSTGPPYPIPVHGGYVFQDPALSVNGEVTVAFVTTLSNGPPVYAFPGHQIPPSFQAPPPHPHGDRADCSVAHSGHQVPPCHPHQGDLVMQPVSVPGSHNHPLVIGHGTTNMGPLPGHMVAPVTVSPTGIPHPQTTQMMYITQLPPTQPSQMDVIVSAPQIPKQPPGDVVNAPVMSKAISGLPPRQKTSLIEFAGPVVFDVSATTNASETAKEKKKVTKDPVIREEKLNQSIDNSSGKIKKSSPKELIIDSKCDEGTTGHQPDHSPNVSGPSPSNKETTPAIINNSSPVSSSNPVKLSVSQETVNNVSSDLSDINDFPKMNSTHSPLSPSALPPKDTTAKETPSKGKAVPPAPKMWSSLFGSKTGSSKSNTTSSSTQSVPVHPSSTTASSPEASVPINKVEPKSVSYWQEQEKAAANSNAASEKVKSVLAKQDPLAPRLLEKLLNFPISHTPIVIQPRGLKNGKNTCFMNATLQVLMGCPPFVHMFRAFKSFPARSGGGSSTPIFDSLVLFVNSFQNGQRAKQNSRGKKGNTLDLNVGVPFSPDPLLSVAQDILGLNIGVQHDAEEFLSQILSICHEELENIIKMNNDMDTVNNNSDDKMGTDSNGHIDSFGNVEGFDEEADDDDDSWQRVGPKNHSVETNVNDCGQTPLSSIFAGLSRSCLQRESGKTSDTLDSFFTLKLDIQADNVHSVKDALLRLNTMEIVHDADGRKVHGQRRMFFDVLPPVLIMHLKLFEYSNGNGQKVQKRISFDVDLQIPKEILSRVGRMKYSSLKSRSYKLFGVVNHHGIRMNDGHYTSDVYLSVANGWLHFDDSEVSPTNEAQVLQYCEGSMPYMLFYRRLDAKE